jgi:hypothetical protein
MSCLISDQLPFMFPRNVVYSLKFHPGLFCLGLTSRGVLQPIPKLGYEFIQTAVVMVEVMGEKDLLRDVVHGFA